MLYGVAAISPELARNIALAGWWTLLGLAVLIFIYIQHYLQDPRRKEINNEWFAQFEANQRAHYSRPGMGWRARDLREHFTARTSGIADRPNGSNGNLPLIHRPII